MDKIPLSEARRRLSELIRAAERGESVAVTRRGKEVARIVPADTEPVRPLPDLAEFRASIRVKGKPLSQAVIDARESARY